MSSFDSKTHHGANLLMLSGLLLAISSGLLLGSFLVPIKLLRIWAWENFWVVWSVVAMLLGPLLVASLSIPHVFQVYGHIPARVLGLTILVGAVAGTSGFLYSRAVPVIGFGLATAFDSGSGLAVGSLLPLIEQPPGFLTQPSGLLSLLGIAIAVCGIIVCAKAGSIRESQARRKVRQSIAQPLAKSGITFFKGVMLSLIAGSIASCMNLGLAFQNEVLEVARRAGASEFGTANAFLAPYLVGGFFSNFLYAGYLAKRNKTMALFRARGTRLDWVWSALMGLMFVLAIAAYSGAVALLGRFGVVVGWGLKTAVAIAISSLWDLSRGEWSGISRRTMLMGVGMLIIAVMLLAWAQMLYVPVKGVDFRR